MCCVFMPVLYLSSTSCRNGITHPVLCEKHIPTTSDSKIHSSFINSTVMNFFIWRGGNGASHTLPGVRSLSSHPAHVYCCAETAMATVCHKASHSPYSITTLFSIKGLEKLCHSTGAIIPAILSSEMLGVLLSVDLDFLQRSCFKGPWSQSQSRDKTEQIQDPGNV